MRVIVKAGSEPRTVDEWTELLPSWFVEACAPERTREEAEEHLRTWRSLSEHDKRLAARSESWRLSGWTYWFEEGNRWWYWWDARTLDDDRLEVVVEMPDVQAGLGSLQWLLRASGALEADVD
jgi:hypothetical protein